MGALQQQLIPSISIYTHPYGKKNLIIQTERSSSNIPEVFSGCSAHQIYIYEHTFHFRDNIHYTHQKYSVSFLCWRYRCLFIAQLNLKKTTIKNFKLL